MRDHQALRGDATGVTDGDQRHSWDETTDVVVVGLGAAGGGAAIEACSAGARVMVIDRFGGGGATAKSAGAIYFGGGTDLQRKNGYEDSPENMFNYLKLETQDAVPESTLRAFCETSVENFNWLRALGVPFPVSGEVVKASLPADDCTLYFSGNELAPPYRDAATPAPRGHRPLGPGLTGHLTGAALRAGTIDAGAELRTYCRADRLVVDGGGEVIGIELQQLPRWMGPLSEAMQSVIQYGGGMLRPAQGPLQRALRTLERAGTRRFVRARRGVILSMGGYVFDPELMAAEAPDYARCSLRLGTAGDDGTGVRMGAAVGGTLGQMDRCSAPRFIDPPTEWWRGILVGRSGQRICNETLYGGKVGEYMIEGHAGRGTVILDHEMMLAGRAQVFASGVHLYQRIFGVINGWVAPSSAPTLAGLAAKIGIDKDRLQQSVDEYNADALAGADRLGKSAEHCQPIRVPPFYGIPLDNDTLLFPTPCLSLGGLRTEGASSRVLGRDGAPIDGLYAAGRTAVGVASQGYASGLSISDGIFAGRIAGRHAAGRTRVTVSAASPR